MEREVSTNDLVAGVLVIVRLEGQHWLGLVLAQPESLQVEKEVRKGMRMIVRMLTMMVIDSMLTMMMILRMLTIRMIVFTPTIK